MTVRLCYVTAYLDIGRETWTHFQRTFDWYFNSFIPLVNMFKSISNEERALYDFIIFIDSKYYDKVKEYVGDINNIVVIPINETFMENNIFAWSKLERETEIMSSKEYKKLISHRLNCPETNNPKYTIINHSKIDFVCFATILSTCQYFCWVDFGYCGNEERTPSYLLNIDLFDKDKINYTLIQPITEKDKNIIFTLSDPRDVVAGCFFLGSREKIEEYQKLYHSVLEMFQDKNLADDDQHLVIQCKARNPDLFFFDCLNGWHRALVHYQKTPILTQLTEIMNRNGSDKGSGHHNYTEYYSKLFDGIRNNSLNVLEIGIGTINPNIQSSMCGTPGGYTPGASIRGWKEYFPNANIYGCDIDRDILFNSDRINTFFLDQTDPKVIQEQIVDNDRVYDIIIDDGLHHFKTNWELLKQIFIRLSPEGYYIIEDILDFNPDVFNESFSEQVEMRYFVIPNPKNNGDNNILVVRKLGNHIPDL